VTPQSAQKKEVMVLPASVGLLYCLGVPETSLKESSVTIKVVLYALPLTLRQSLQWQTA
jgi:hypothetical protein